MEKSIILSIQELPSRLCLKSLAWRLANKCSVSVNSLFSPPVEAFPGLFSISPTVPYSLSSRSNSPQGGAFTSRETRQGVRDHEFSFRN